MKSSKDHKLLKALLMIAISIGAVSLVLPAVPRAHASPSGPCDFVPTTSPVVYITNATGTGSSQPTLSTAGSKVTFHVCVANVGPFNRWAVQVKTDASVLNPQTPGISLLGSVLPSPSTVTNCVNGGSTTLGLPGNINCSPTDGIRPLSSDPAISFVGSPTATVIYDQNAAAVFGGFDTPANDAAVGIFISSGSTFATPDIMISGVPPANGTSLSLDPLILYVDAENNGVWDPGETVVYDADNSGTFTAGDTVIAGTAPPSCSPCGLVDSVVSNGTNPTSISVGSTGALLFSVNYTAFGGPGTAVQLSSVQVSEGSDPIQVSVQAAKGTALSSTAPDFSLRIVPVTRNYLQGGSMLSTLTLTSVNITSSLNPLRVMLSASVPSGPGPSPPGPTPLLGTGGCGSATFTGATLIVPVPANGTAIACMQVSVGFNFATGVYTVKVTATNSTILQTHSVSRTHTAFLVHTPGSLAATSGQSRGGFYGPTKALTLDSTCGSVLLDVGTTCTLSVHAINAGVITGWDVIVQTNDPNVLSPKRITVNTALFASGIDPTDQVGCVNGGSELGSIPIPPGQSGNLNCAPLGSTRCASYASQFLTCDANGIAHSAVRGLGGTGSTPSADQELFNITFIARGGPTTQIFIVGGGQGFKVCAAATDPLDPGSCTQRIVFQIVSSATNSVTYGTTLPNFLIKGPFLTDPLFVSPIKVAQASFASSSITLVAYNGFTNPVTLTRSCSPSGGATTPPVISLGSYTVTPTPAGAPDSATATTSQTTTSTIYTCTVTGTDSISGITHTLPMPVIVTPVGQPDFAKSGLTQSSRVPLGGQETWTALVRNPTLTPKCVQVLVTVTPPSGPSFLAGSGILCIPSSFNGQLIFGSGDLTTPGTYKFTASIIFADTSSPSVFISTSSGAALYSGFINQFNTNLTPSSMFVGLTDPIGQLASGSFTVG